MILDTTLAKLKLLRKYVLSNKCHPLSEAETVTSSRKVHC